MTQAEALDILKLGFNVFLTGAAGAGKTHVLNEFISHLRANDIGVGVTASTGIAATHMNGMTIHSWAGIGIKDYLDETDLKLMTARSQLKKRFADTKVLIIDEISMLHGNRLDLVDQVARAFKDSEKPFGGLQVVLSGDLFQLPPVTKGKDDTDWVFASNAWNTMNLKICYLTEQHRQDDSTLLEVLNAIRANTVDEYHFEHLQDRFVQSENPRVTRLYTHNADVDKLNTDSLKAIDADARSYYMQSTGSKRYIELLSASCPAPEVLELKLDAEVMFVTNKFEMGFVNGTRGRVVEFAADNSPVIETTEGRRITAEPHTWEMRDGDKVRATISQLPIRLAWAITIHKSQGMTLDAAEIDLSRAFEPGMGYVALSRVRDLAGLHLLGANNQAMVVHPVVLELDERLRRESDKTVDALKSIEKDLKQHHERVRKSLAPVDPAEAADPEVLAALKDWRSDEAKDRSVPPYVIMHDTPLMEIAGKLPKTTAELQAISGIGPKKIEDYGKELLSLVDKHRPKS